MQRKPTKNTRGPNTDEKRYMSWIKDGCYKCAACMRYTDLIGHHCEGATFKHNKTLIGHWFILGLCQECDDIVTHGSRKALRQAYGPQCDMWEIQYMAYKFDTDKDPCPDDVYESIMDWNK